ncbi:cuticle protein 19.8-like [Uloborus diversus]|uniref:cuticle protein 19.8-like n=1 Tax=Uloborus diversus TaxID=327109 RepID=UPI002409F66E|nr:cuticle protein 19.8-like [Uloborus diversus]
MVATSALLILFLATLLPSVLSEFGGFNHEDFGPPKPYTFGYKVHDKDGDQWRSDAMDSHGKVEGSYGYVDTHGMQREVHYVADDDGFRAQIKTNEPGMNVPNPADVYLQAEPPAEYDAAIYGVEDLGPVYRSNDVQPPVPRTAMKAVRGRTVPRTDPKTFYKYHRFAEASVPPIYVVDGHLQSPWFPMEVSTI